MNLSPKREVLVICAALTVAILGVYGPVRHQEFVNYDDVDHVIGNPNVQQGLGWHAIAWAFTTGHAGNWKPLTWLSQMLDCQLFGLEAGAHKLVGTLVPVVGLIQVGGQSQGQSLHLRADGGPFDYDGVECAGIVSEDTGGGSLAERHSRRGNHRLDGGNLVASAILAEQHHSV